LALALGLIGVAAGIHAGSAEPARQIDFGPAGPLQTITYEDADARASLAYRIAPDRDDNTGPAAVSPSISSGTLTLVVHGTTRMYDLSEILANHEQRVVLPVDPLGSCGADRPLSRSGDYLVVQSILTGKGCEPMATFIELRTGSVAQPGVYDPRWLHRFDPTPERLSGTDATMIRTEPVTTTRRELESGPGPGARRPWRFLIVHVVDATSHDRLLEIDEEPVVATVPITLSPGSHVLLAPVTAFADELLFAAGPETRIIQPSLADEARYDALQTPTPHGAERAIRRGLWLNWADDAAYRGDFAGAVSALAMMLSYDDNASFAPGEAHMLAQCRRLLARVNAGAISARAAAATYSNGCLPTPAH